MKTVRQITRQEKLEKLERFLDFSERMEENHFYGAVVVALINLAIVVVTAPIVVATFAFELIMLPFNFWTRRKGNEKEN